MLLKKVKSALKVFWVMRSTLVTFWCPIITKNNGFKFNKEGIFLHVNEDYGQSKHNEMFVVELKIVGT